MGNPTKTDFFGALPDMKYLLSAYISALTNNIRPEINLRVNISLRVRILGACQNVQILSTIKYYLFNFSRSVPPKVLKLRNYKDK